ncbi:MAG: trigger factor [Lachnospiraceae bacterium]|jgi:trigger factor|nr:trigger factor [Lachnospiraceae bacterium]MCI1398668.1 trigger factor [Lachnospiraceae bacterium]MCI1424822.1 trigger factor [Lachnospiraceae bacterium]MCI1453516.1 trigger factor [Lachnospiraceae bacterium]MDD5849777.1 trigger factor [Bacillota bacterium]
MSVSVEKLEKSMAKLTITVSAEDFIKALDKAYAKQKNRISVPGFRKGHATRQIIQRMYGAGVFFEDAANEAINESYAAAAKESGEKIVSNPTIDITQIEEGKDFIYTAEVALEPPVELGQYKGVEIAKVDVKEVTEEDIDKELKRQQDANAKIIDVTDRPVANGDMIKLDFDGSIDGVPFEGGKAENYDLTVGSGSFIPGFEDQLVGMNAGEEKDVKVTFPEDYNAKELAGKEAVFHCKVNSIRTRQLPELNDEFADEVSEFDTLDEYKADIKKNLEVKREEDAKTTRENEAVDAAIKNATIEIPAPMLTTQEENLAEEMAQNLRYQGMNLEDYLKYTGMTRDQFLESMKPQAERRIRTRLTLEAVAKAENIEVSDEEFDDEIKKMADQYKTPVENIKNYFSSDEAKNDLKADIAVQKAVTLLAENAVEVEKKEEEKKDEAEAEAPKTEA